MFYLLTSITDSKVRIVIMAHFVVSDYLWGVHDELSILLNLLFDYEKFKPP